MSSSNWWSTISSLSEIAETLLSKASDDISKASSELEQQHKQFLQENTVGNRQQNLIYLPWDPLFLGSIEQSVCILEQEVMERILLLPQSSMNFTTCPINSTDSTVKSNWNFSSFVPVAMRLLEIDSNLQRMHAKLSPKMDEELFWFYYYCRILYIRAIVGMDGSEEQKKASSYPQDIIYSESLPPPPQSHMINSNSSDKIDSRTDNDVEKTSVGETKQLTSLDDEDIDLLLDDMLLEENDKEVDGYLLPSSAVATETSTEVLREEEDDDDAELERQIARELAEDDL